MQEYHCCHAIGCFTEVKPALLMCRAHWRLVPNNFKTAVLRTYRKGQEIDKKPTERYYRAQLAAINHVATLEGKAPIDVEKRINYLKQHGHIYDEQLRQVQPSGD